MASSPWSQSELFELVFAKARLCSHMGKLSFEPGGSGIVRLLAKRAVAFSLVSGKCKGSLECGAHMTVASYVRALRELFSVAAQQHGIFQHDNELLEYNGRVNVCKWLGITPPPPASTPRGKKRSSVQPPTAPKRRVFGKQVGSSS